MVYALAETVEMSGMMLYGTAEGRSLALGLRQVKAVEHAMIMIIT